ncbi:hypothetical protein INT43_009068 [Umbelopsis isabellina]|uniref:Mitochondrial inner membrane protease subunit 2 n=1 Tax=Mortierella isabellina TaxID=91625 RepID=A0A8H7PCL9_MORIS|nr:hypothetical protein INT43_009068 [Umbelopsis isabellina]
MTSRLWSHPNTRAAIKTLTWFPVIFFFLENGFSTATVQGRSMQPTFNPDSNKLTPDVVLLSHWGAIGHKFKRGEVVAMTSPHNPNLTITKRIIALEGDTVRPLPQSEQKSAVHVPKGHCWVEGDESFHSRDSNFFGAVPLGLISSKVTYILWPLSRFGKVELKPNRDRVSVDSVDAVHLNQQKSKFSRVIASSYTNIRMENYRRQPITASETDAGHTLIKHAENELLISASGKINRYVTVGLELLEKNKTVVIVGSGKAVSKTVSVTEIIKRRMEGALHQYTQIGSSTSTEKWNPVENKEFDQLVVSKHIPVLTIYLCHEPSPDLEKVSGYQPPTKEGTSSGTAGTTT